jgi:FkbM family methyltransferase
MLISIGELSKVFKVSPRKVLHVGAHLAEEYEEMRKFGWGVDGVIWVESQEALCDLINSRFSGTNNKVVCATVWSEDNVKKVFHENINTQCSSLFELGILREISPEMVEVNSREVITRKIDSIISTQDQIDFINLDIQGSELEALKGAMKTLSTVKWVYTEVNRKEIYKSCPLIEEIDLFLKDQGFSRAATRWSFREDWGDALYVRNHDVFQSVRFKIKELISTKLLTLRYRLHDLKASLR